MRCCAAASIAAMFEAVTIRRLNVAKPDRVYLMLKRLLALSLLPLMLTACASHNGLWQAYPGEPLPLDAVAIVRGKTGYRDPAQSNEMIRIVEVNGKSVPNQRGVAPGAEAVTLLPGIHLIRIMYLVALDYKNFYLYHELPVNVQANCHYQIVALSTIQTPSPQSTEDIDIRFHLHGMATNSQLRANCSNVDLAPGETST